MKKVKNMMLITAMVLGLSSLFVGNSIPFMAGAIIAVTAIFLN